MSGMLTPQTPGLLPQQTNSLSVPRQLFTTPPVMPPGQMVGGGAPGSGLAAAMSQPHPMPNLQTPTAGIPLASMMQMQNMLKNSQLADQQQQDQQASAALAAPATNPGVMGGQGAPMTATMSPATNQAPGMFSQIGPWLQNIFGAQGSPQ